jgi:hypothetical protein
MMTRQQAVEIRAFASETADAPRSLPWQLFKRLRLRASGRGELRLAVAILEDAVRCLDKNRSGGFMDRMLRWEAEQWIGSTDRGPLFSFERICSLLDVNARELRDLLLHPRPKSGAFGVRAAALEGPVPQDAVLPSGMSTQGGSRRRG